MAGTLQWQDLFVVFDDGHIGIAEYRRIEPQLASQAANHEEGLSCLVVIPHDAAVPPAEVRAHLGQMLDRLPMRALAYVVEGEGFKAAAVRAVLLGLGVFQKKTYRTKVFTEKRSALKWLYEGLRRDLAAAIVAIDAARSA